MMKEIAFRVPITSRKMASMSSPPAPKKTVFSSRQIARAVFAVALITLILVFLASYNATNRLVASGSWVSHTRELQTLLEDVRSNVIEAAYARRGYVIIGQESELAGYYAATQELPAKLSRLRVLAAANSSQLQRLGTLQSLIDHQLATLKQSIDLKKNGLADSRTEGDLIREGTGVTHQIISLIQDMEAEENRLLDQRKIEAAQSYRRTIAVLAGAFAFAILLIAANFYRLNLELGERERAERLARESEELIDAFFSSSTVGFGILDSELRYRRINDVLAHTAGMQPEQFIGKTVRELFDDRASPAVESVLKQVLASDQPVLDRGVSVEVLDKPGELRHWLVNYFPIHGSQGKVTQIGIIATDVSARKNAEEAYRRLSGRLLRLQDDERRRIARELHDSLGQYLTALKINLGLLNTVSEEKKPELFSEALQLSDQCLIETRTLSHLLHPPLLDETGFASAAKWYVGGFAERSGIKLNLDLPPDLDRLPSPLETALFRVLQESLTNIHRHSQSAAAEILVRANSEYVTLTVKDHGRGMPPQVLQRFREDGTQAGIGLAGMRERVHELGGELDIQSTAQGTSITVTIPLSAEVKAPPRSRGAGSGSRSPAA